MKIQEVVINNVEIRDTDTRYSQEIKMNFETRRSLFIKNTTNQSLNYMIQVSYDKGLTWNDTTIAVAAIAANTYVTISETSGSMIPTLMKGLVRIKYTSAVAPASGNVFGIFTAAY